MPDRQADQNKGYDRFPTDPRFLLISLLPITVVLFQYCFDIVWLVLYLLEENVVVSDVECLENWEKKAAELEVSRLVYRNPLENEAMKNWTTVVLNYGHNYDR